MTKRHLAEAGQTAARRSAETRGVDLIPGIILVSTCNFQCTPDVLMGDRRVFDASRVSDASRELLGLFSIFLDDADG